MATFLFHEWSQDHPFDPSDRHLQKNGEKPSRSERKDAKEHRQLNKRWEKEHGETYDAYKERMREEERAAKEAELARQKDLAERMNQLVGDHVQEIGLENANDISNRIIQNQNSGLLSEDQLNLMDEAIQELESIQSRRNNNEITQEAYNALVKSFKESYSDLILDGKEVAMLRGMVDERLTLMEDNLKRVEAARESRNLSELEELALAFVTEEGSGDHPNVDADRLKPGTTYDVDFHNPNGTVNWTAHNNVRLGHIMSATRLTKVHVQKKNGFEGDAYLWPDGKTYTNPPWEKNKGNYVAIVSGDKFTVLPDSYATAPTVDTTGAEEIAAEMTAEANLESEQFRTEVAIDNSESLAEAEQILDGSYKVDIPLDVAKLKGADLEASLRAMDMGDYVIEICDQLAGLPGSVAEKGSGTSLFINMMEKGNRRKMALGEITQVIFGVSGKAFMEKYNEVKTETQTLSWIEGQIVEFKDANPDKTAIEFYAKMATEMPPTPESRGVLYKYHDQVFKMYEGYTPNSGVDSINRPDDVKMVFSTRTVHKEFLLGAHRVLKAVPLMKVADFADSSVDRSLAKSAELSDVAEPAIAAIFPPDEGAPATKAGFWKNVTRRVGDEANMGNLGEHVAYDEDKEYQKLFTSLYAYNEIRSKVTRIENGEEVVDLNLLADTLEMYRKQGKILMDKDLRDERRESGRQVMYPDEPITVETLQDMSKLSPLTIELVQHGMMLEQMKDYSKLRDAVIESFPADVAEPLRAMNGQYEFTPEELQEIGNNIRMAQVAMIHFTQSEIQHLNAEGEIPEESKGGRPVNPKEMNLGATQSFTIFDRGTDKITMSMGFNYNAQWDSFIPNSFEENYSIHLGPSYTKTLGKEERTRVTLSTGVGGPFPGEMQWAGAASLSISHDWGEYNTWKSGIHATLGPNLAEGASFMDKLALIHAGVTLVDINQEQVVVKRASELYEKNKEFIDSQLALLDARLDEAGGELNQLTPAQLEQVKGMLHQYYKEEITFDVLDDMNRVLFDKVGIEATARPPYIELRIGIAVMSKPQMFYIKSDHFNVTEFADRDLKERAAKAGADGYKLLSVSGNLVLSGSGERTYGREADKAFDPYDDLDAANEYFMNNQGLKIERTPNSGEFHLLPLQVDGLVEVYGDRNEGVDVYPWTDGEFYFSIPAGTDLAIHRQTHVMPLPDGGAQEITRIYITDNPNKSPEQVRLSHTHHVEGYVSQRKGGRNSVAKENQHLLAEQVVQNNEELIGEWPENDVMAAQGNLDTALGSYNAYAGVETARYKDMESFVKSKSEAIKKSISFKKATLGDSNEAYAKALLDVARPYMDEFGIDQNNSAEVTAFLQLVLIEDRSTASTDPEKFITHIEGWNRKSITKSLEKAGVEGADTIARKISSYYAIQMRMAIKDGEFHLPETQVATSALVQTHIGEYNRAAGGNVMEFLNGAQDSVGLEGAMVMDAELMKFHFKMTDKEVADFQKALEAQMAPTHLDNPDLAFQNPIALQILQDGATFFGPEYTEALAAIASREVQSKSELTGIELEAYEAFEGVMGQLTAESGPGVRTASYEGRTIRIKVDMQMGYIYKCRNFTTTFKAERLQAVSGQRNRTMDSVSAKAARTMFGAEAVGGVSYGEVPHERQPHEESTREAEGEGEEEAGGEVGDLVDGPHTSPGHGDQGQGGQSTDTGDNDLDE